MKITPSRRFESIQAVMLECRVAIQKKKFGALAHFYEREFAPLDLAIEDDFERLQDQYELVEKFVSEVKAADEEFWAALKEN